MVYRFLIILVVFSFGFQGGVFAQEQEPEDPLKAQSKALTGKVGGIMKTLDQKQMFHFMVVYQNYNVVSLVKAVRDDVSDAITACGENNPQMKSDLDARFEAWDENVGGQLEEARANINNMAIAQDYISQNELKGIFAQVDQLRSVNSSNFEKTPVTSPEACEFMMSKMDETETNMGQMLMMTLQSYPDILQKTQE